MRTATRLVLSLTMLAAMFGTGRAQALTYNSCSANYSASSNRSCTFTPGGPNLSIEGYAAGGEVTIRITDLTGSVVLLKCSGMNSCQAQAGPNHTGTDSVGLPPAGPLLCQVATGSSGFMRCASGI